MSAGYLRELTFYTLIRQGALVKNRKVIHCATRPPREADTGEKLLPQHSIFLPRSLFLFTWALLLLLAFIYQVITIPVFLTFDVFDNTETLALDIVCTAIFAGDILVNFNAFYYEYGELIWKRRQIAANYLRNWFIIDLLSAFPYHRLFELSVFHETDQDYGFDTHRVLRCLRLLLIFKLPHILDTIRQRMASRTFSFLFSCVLLSIAVLSIAHWVACGFYYVARFGPEHKNWIFVKKFGDMSKLDLYIIALDWTMSTLTTTGYGDIVPCSFQEKIYGTLILTLSIGIFSYFVGKISVTVSLIDKDDAEHKEMRLAITRYLKDRALPKGTMNRALRHFEYSWVRHKQDSRKSNTRIDRGILDHFSEPLKNEICENIYGRVLSQVPVFQLFESALIRKISRAVETFIFAPDDIVISEGERSTELYFLERGSAEVFHQQTQHTYILLEVRNMQSGRYFGEVAFFIGCERSASVRCLQFCDLLRLKRGELLKLLTLSPSDMLTYRKIMEYYECRSLDALGIRCYLCQEANHLARNCPNCRIRVNKDNFRSKWLRRRSSGVIIHRGSIRECYLRRKRKIRSALRYTIRNVKAQESWNRLKGARYLLTKHITQSAYNPAHEEDLVQDDGDEDLEYCPVSMSSQDSSDMSVSSEDDRPTREKSNPVPSLLFAKQDSIRENSMKKSHALTEK